MQVQFQDRVVDPFTQRQRQPENTQATVTIKSRRREMRQQELKVRGQATSKVNSFCALLMTTRMNQTTIFHFSRSNLEQLCVQRSQLRPRTPDLHPSASGIASSLLGRTASQPNKSGSGECQGGSRCMCSGRPSRSEAVC